MERHRAHSLKRGWPSSPCCEPPRGLFGDGEVMKREIEATAAGCPTAVCTGRGERVSGLEGSEKRGETEALARFI
jgi:hypothetical protein